ncbi:MAG: SRPBCC family protein [Kofleriaceae bacterium]|nr:SRPBCC family protein [Kofleriaceae bacterium]MBP9206691.1 SRPBCC family protein [Kofleriaceae bacterium]
MTVDATVEIACDAGQCWALLCDPRLIPEWVTGVAEAHVLASDEAGRPIQVRFGGMPSVGSLDYVMAYRYDDAARVLWWETLPGADRRITGEARLIELGPGRCRLDYALGSKVGDTVPPWARASLAGDTPEKVVRSFQRFAEARAGRAGA